MNKAYARQEALKISRDLVKDGLLVGEELTDYINGMDVTFKTKEELNYFEDLVLELAEERKKHIKVTDTVTGETYKFEKSRHFADLTNIPKPNITQAIRIGCRVAGRFEVKYDYWKTSDLIKGIKYFKGNIDFDYSVACKVQIERKSVYLDTKVRITDERTGIVKNYENGRLLCNAFKINKSTFTNCVRMKCRYKKRYRIELLS